VITIFSESKFQDIIDSFTIGKVELERIAAAFRRDIVLGLEGDSLSSFKMLQSYLALPTRAEKGQFIALDFGGTNVRALLIELLGDGKVNVIKKAAKQLVTADYNYISANTTAESLFDFIAGLILEVADSDKEYLLGHTFSFPSMQTDLNNARLITWTKEFATTGVEGEVVNDLLKVALERRGASNIKPVAVINDTVATLLAAAYKRDRTDIGSICGTGHNTAYLESYQGLAKPRMILNLESGNFDKLFTNPYDKMIDERSEKPGEQRMEKMVSGKYLGVLFYLAICDALELEDKAVEFDGADLSVILSDQSQNLKAVRQLMQDKMTIELEEEMAVWVKAIAESVVIRSARLVATSYIAIIWHIDGDEAINEHTVAIDGSLFEKMPLYKESMQQAMYEMIGEDAQKVHLMLENSGSGVGAAIAAAI